jgi:hypothetical protein
MDYRDGVRSAGLLDLAVADAARANAHSLGGSVYQSPHGLKVDVPTPVGQVVSMADPVPELGTAAADLANSCHD